MVGIEDEETMRVGVQTLHSYAWPAWSKYTVIIAWRPEIGCIWFDDGFSSIVHICVAIGECHTLVDVFDVPVCRIVVVVEEEFVEEVDLWIVVVSELIAGCFWCTSSTKERSSCCPLSCNVGEKYGPDSSPRNERREPHDDDDDDDVSSQRDTLIQKVA